MEWYPIETAPKDGYPFLGYWPKEGCYVLISWWIPKGWLRKGGWWSLVGSRAPKGNPTHWMPLPPPPTSSLA